jgi:uncharacterized OB-fold protein
VSRLLPQTGDIPEPRPTITSAPFWEGCARGELWFQRCRHCAAAVHTPAIICGRCWSKELFWEQSSGEGTVYSWTVVWRPQTPAFTVPYAPIIVDMTEGWQILSSLVDCEDDEVEVGMAVRVVFHPLPGGLQLPYFAPDPAARPAP